MSGWQTVRLGDLAESVDYGVTASANAQPVGPKFLRITDIQDGKVDWGAVPYCEADERALNSSRLRAGDIVFARTGATTGKSFLIRECPADSVFASYLIRVRPGAAVDPSYLSHFFKSQDYWAQITSGARGAAQPGVNATTLQGLKVPLPNFEDQKRIAAILDQAEYLIEKNSIALARLEQLESSRFEFACQESYGVFFLGDVADFYAGGTLPGGEAFSGQLDGYLLLRVSDMNIPGNEVGIYKSADWSSLSGTKSATCPPGSVVIPKRGGAIGTNKKRITTRASVLDPNLMAIYPKVGVLELSWLYCWFKGVDLAGICNGSTVPQLNKKDLAPLEIKIPSSEVQLKFAEFVGELSAQRDRYMQQRTTLIDLFASLQHRAFRGEL